VYRGGVTEALYQCERVADDGAHDVEIVDYH
jgi:hypothetical protein